MEDSEDCLKSAVDLNLDVNAGLRKDMLKSIMVMVMVEFTDIWTVHFLGAFSG